MKLNDNFKFGLLVIVVAGSMLVQCYHPRRIEERVKVFYDCRIAEISPDVPLPVRQECRRLMEKK